MNDDLFENWLQGTRELQETAYGLDYSSLTTEKQIDYIAWNTKAATHELVELDNETSWKPWAADEPYVNREEVIGEAIDVLHFVANVLCAVGCTDSELNKRYLMKMEKNRARQRLAGGYRVLAEGAKCTRCRRALDDVMPSLHDATLCERCAKEPPDGLVR